ncbi:MAG TPA: tetratricopeptide repeat protein [Candidatus Ozemobacteraceae bacterium]|nr:tetratricopeptide repeat protein [Candidatus Ozemobacteraceae bacterium]HQG28630.1 tetratricopeptide repeat protein [Candidatus Ozemobacteraceae bacterium]
MRRNLLPALFLFANLMSVGLAAPAQTASPDALKARALAPQTTSVAAINEGAKLLSAGRSLEAEEALQKAVAANPASAEGFYNLGLALAFNGKHGDALEAYKKALSLRADFPEASLGLGTTLLTLGQPQPALEAFEAVLARTPDSPVGQAALFNKGTALGHLKRYTEAELALSEALAANPDDPSPAFQIGRLKMEQQKWKDALGWLETTAAAFPLEANLLSGKAHIQLKDGAAAEKSLKLAADSLAAAAIADDARARLSGEIARLRQEAAQLAPK